MSCDYVRNSRKELDCGLLGLEGLEGCWTTLTGGTMEGWRWRHEVVECGRFGGPLEARPTWQL